MIKTKKLMVEESRKSWGQSNGFLPTKASISNRERWTLRRTLRGVSHKTIWLEQTLWCSQKIKLRRCLSKYRRVWSDRCATSEKIPCLTITNSKTIAFIISKIAIQQTRLAAVFTKPKLQTMIKETMFTKSWRSCCKIRRTQSIHAPSQNKTRINPKYSRSKKLSNIWI